MKRFTKRQRMVIYEKAAAQCLVSPSLKCFLCGILSDISGVEVPYVNGCDYSKVLAAFPEFALFRPSRGAVLWFEEHGNPKSSMWARVDCMLFCAELCKSPIVHATNQRHKQTRPVRDTTK